MKYESVQSRNNIFHLITYDRPGLRTECGINLDRRYTDHDPWQCAPLSSFLSPPWGRKCKRCDREWNLFIAKGAAT